LPNALEGTVWLLAKILVFLYMYIWFRATLPRLRYDQLMDLGWKLLIPVSLGWFMLLAAQRLARQNGWNIIFVTGGSIAVLVICYLLMQAAFAKSARDRSTQGTMF
ncbi:MAG: NADH-quinone oxidoreductase subunit H, partial [Actinobacteria bacterium]|nr:NADH-quinone oxidoreductase subunit H [Actinomycetota bacterium]